MNTGKERKQNGSENISHKHIIVQKTFEFLLKNFCMFSELFFFHSPPPLSDKHVSQEKTFLVQLKSFVYTNIFFSERGMFKGGVINKRFL